MKRGTKSVRTKDRETRARAFRINAAGAKLGSDLPRRSERLKRKKWNGTKSCGEVRSSELDWVDPVYTLCTEEVSAGKRLSVITKT